MSSPPVRDRKRVAIPIVIVTLLALPAAAIGYKLVALGYALGDIMPRTERHVTLTMSLDGHGRDVKVRTYLPQSDEHQSITGEANQGPALRFAAEADGGDKLGVWVGGGVGDATEVTYTFSVLAEPIASTLGVVLAEVGAHKGVGGEDGAQAPQL